MAEITAIEFSNEVLKLIDQRVLPGKLEYFECRNYRDVEFAIKDMVVRGAPAIGATAGYGAYLAARELMKKYPSDRKAFLSEMDSALDFLNNSRPTAVNLMWAIAKMKKELENHKDDAPHALLDRLKALADTILNEDIETNHRMAEHGNAVISKGATILTHCNTGALATAGYGTALGVIREAHNTGKNIFVYADETRPRNQGSRLTSWELMQERIPSKLIVDSTAATLIRDGKIDVILVGADRIAGNGDAANKIGTFMLSVVAKAYGVPFYIVAPTTTIDFQIKTGDDIVIEERAAEEITHIEGVAIAPEGMDVYNPAFDVTPHENITGIITEKGILEAPFTEAINKLSEEK